MTNPKTTLKRDRSPGKLEESQVISTMSRSGGGTAAILGKSRGGADGYRMEREWDPEPCGCGWHVLCNPERIGMLRDNDRRGSVLVNCMPAVLSCFLFRRESDCVPIGVGAHFDDVDYETNKDVATRYIS